MTTRTRQRGRTLALLMGIAFSANLLGDVPAKIATSYLGTCKGGSESSRPYKAVVYLHNLEGSASPFRLELDI